jgi:hypothetical protein
MVTMYMPLLNEGTDVWRPVEVTPLSGGMYLVQGPMPADEVWALVPGTLVHCRWKTFADGDVKLVPIRNASPKASYWLTKLAIVAGVVGVSLMPFTTDLNWIVAPSPYSTPYFAAWAVVSGAAYYHWRGVRLVRQTAGPLSLLFSAMAILALFA